MASFANAEYDWYVAHWNMFYSLGSVVMHFRGRGSAAEALMYSLMHGNVNDIGSVNKINFFL